MAHEHSPKLDGSHVKAVFTTYGIGFGISGAILLLYAFARYA
jgi:hypothetical protein